uniref:Uncharacterized protein n=1 Tax=Denticeps clupeoides TaxID=299321 RepID=A0AAY4A4F6_9TELE
MAKPADMASSSSYLSEDQLRCSICLDVFTDPVSTPCGHNFCMGCIKEYWDNCSQTQCPVCKEIHHERPELRLNTSLSEMTAQFRMLLPEKASSATPTVSCDICTDQAVKTCLMCLTSYCETHLEHHKIAARLKRHELMDPVENLEDYVCSNHERPLKFFCRDDQTCVCQFCTEGDHRGHNTVPLAEEYVEKKSQLMKTQTEVQQMIQDRQSKIQEIKDQVESKKAEGLIKDLQQEITELQRRNSELEKISHTEDHLHLLQVSISISLLHHRTTLPMLRGFSSLLLYCRSTQHCAALHTPRTGLFICLRTVDVTLDPDSAHPHLILSADGKRVSDGDTEQHLPDNPERFDCDICVLGKEGFSSGRFYFEVEVGGKAEWDLGVARESINRKGTSELNPTNGYWSVALRRGNQYSAADDPSVPLCLHREPQKVGVFVDYEEGLVSFYDVENSSHIYSFTGQSFSEKLYPYFCPSLNYGTRNSAPMIISPTRKSDLSFN